jgi:hypothetical protein
MSQAQVRVPHAKESGIPDLSLDTSDEPKTEPRMRIPLPLVPAPAGKLPRWQASVSEATRLLGRLRYVPPVVLGALLGSAPYLVQQHARANVGVVDAPPPAAEVETSQLAAASPALAAAEPPVEREPNHAPAPLPPPSVNDNELEVVEIQPDVSRATSLERSLLTRARQQLQSGDGMGAQLTLERLARRMPRGKLVQQRKLLEIRVYQAIGATAAARRAASDFARAYPRSKELRKLSALLLGS